VQEGGSAQRTRRSSDGDESSPEPGSAKGEDRKSLEGYRERWLAKVPRRNLHSWLTCVCSACEGWPGSEGAVTGHLTWVQHSLPIDLGGVICRNHFWEGMGGRTWPAPLLRRISA
jgi:hypothetical protein